MKDQPHQHQSKRDHLTTRLPRVKVGGRLADVRFESLGNGVFGFISYDIDDVSKIYINSDMPLWRQKLALIHELLHLTLKRRRKVSHFHLHLFAIFLLLWDKYGDNERFDFSFSTMFKHEPLTDQKLGECIIAATNAVLKEINYAQS